MKSTSSTPTTKAIEDDDDDDDDEEEEDADNALPSVSRHDIDREFGNAYTDGGEAQKITWATVYLILTNFADTRTGLCATLSEDDKAALKVENWNYFYPLAKQLNSIITKICSRYATYKEFEDSNFQGIDVVISSVSTILEILKTLNVELIQFDDFDSDMITHNVKEYFKKCMDALNDYAGRKEKIEIYKAQRKCSLLHVVFDVVFFNNATKSVRMDDPSFAGFAHALSDRIVQNAPEIIKKMAFELE